MRQVRLLLGWAPVNLKKWKTVITELAACKEM